MAAIASSAGSGCLLLTGYESVCVLVVGVKIALLLAHI